MQRMVRLAILAALLAACSIPFNYTINVVQYLEAEGTFQVGAGGISPNPKTVGPVQVTWDPDPRVTVAGATLNFKVCFTSLTPGASFSGDLSYAAYLGENEATLFQESNKVAQGTRDIAGLSNGQVCTEGQASLTESQLAAIRSGTFFVGARISGTAISNQEATIRYRAEVFDLRISGSVRP